MSQEELCILLSAFCFTFNVHIQINPPLVCWLFNKALCMRLLIYRQHILIIDWSFMFVLISVFLLKLFHVLNYIINHIYIEHLQVLSKTFIKNH